MPGKCFAKPPQGSIAANAARRFPRRRKAKVRPLGATASGLNRKRGASGNTKIDSSATRLALGMSRSPKMRISSPMGLMFLGSAKGAARATRPIRNWLAPRSVLREFLGSGGAAHGLARR